MRKAPESPDQLDENMLLSPPETLEAIDQHFRNDEMQCQIHFRFSSELINEVLSKIQTVTDDPFIIVPNHHQATLYVTNAQWEPEANRGKLEAILKSFSCLNIEQFRVESWSQHKEKQAKG